MSSLTYWLSNGYEDTSRGTMVIPIQQRARLLNVAALLAVLLLLLVPFAFPLDGKVHADWQQFLGRFHPLAVHLPIGLLLLVPALDFAGRWRPALRDGALFLLVLSVPACLGTVLLGYLLAYGSGQTGAVVTRHMWSGIILTLLVGLCAKLKAAPMSFRYRAVERFAYPALLGIILAVLSYAAHQGGTLTHGDTYLTEYLPGFLKRLFSIPAAHAAGPAPAGSFYVQQVHPVLDNKCLACHGPTKVKGGLRLDSYDAIMKGGHSGAAVVSHQPEKSLLLQRVNLPHGDEKFMPAEGRAPLKKDEVALLTAWIADGASLTATAVKGIRIREAEPAVSPISDYTAALPQLHDLAQSQGVSVVPVSLRSADGLILNTVDSAQAFDSAKLAAYRRFAPYIVEMYLARTSVNDDAIPVLASFPHLRVLHLEGSKVLGSNLQQLTRLPELSYVNLSDTRVSKDAVAPLLSMKQLHHLYLYNTPAQPATTEGTH